MALDNWEHPAYHLNMIGDNLLRFKPHQKYVVFDCETCNLNLLDVRNCPWQWGWKVCTLKETISESDYLVQWPEIAISKDAQELTGFYQRRVDEEGKSPEFVLAEFEKVLYDPQYLLIAHNALNFDVYLHQIHRKLLGKPINYDYLPRLLDTNALARAWRLNSHPKEGEDRLSFQYKFANLYVKGIKTSLRVLAPEFNIEYDAKAAHDAMYDVRVLHQVWQQLVYKLEI